MARTARIAAFLAATLLSACGGGGSLSPAAVQSSSPATASKTPIATGNLTLHFPTTFHQAKATAARRGPAYVNSSTSNFIDIYVDGTDVLPATPISATNADGSQTLSVPIFSTSSYVVAVETDGSGNLLALGETDLSPGQVTPGSAPSLSLVMLMNATQFGAMSSPTNANLDATTVSPLTVNLLCPNAVYPFVADPSGGFVTAAGLGSVVPTVTNVANIPGTSPADTFAALGSGQQTGYAITFNGDTTTGHGVRFTLSAVNPAAAIINDANTYYYSPGSGQYPGIEHLYNSSVTILPLDQISTATTITGSFDVQTNGIAGC